MREYMRARWEAVATKIPDTKFVVATNSHLRVLHAQPADLADRLVAEHNACRGISTAALDGLSLREFITLLAEATDRDRLSAPVRDALDKLLLAAED